VTTLATVEPAARADAAFIAKAAGIVAGLEVADRVFSAVDPELKSEWAVKDGARVAVGDVIGHVRGPTRSVLVAERVALNFMQRMSGIATATAAMVAAVEGTGTRCVASFYCCWWCLGLVVEEDSGLGMFKQTKPKCKTPFFTPHPTPIKHAQHP
jgi:nicotinate-nucleotide pyrophosphorylase